MKTTDLLTFFHPTESTGSSWTFPLRKEDMLVAQFWVFTWGEEDLSRFSNSTAASPEEFDALYSDLRSAIQQSGGIVVFAIDYNDVARVQIYRTAAPGYAPPETMLRLRPFGDATPEKITNKVDLEISDHLLLPVSRDSEARLNELRDNLKGLPSDLESSIINIIRRPSLEWRLERIERTLSLPSASQADQKQNRVRRDGLLEELYGYVMWKVPIGPAVVVALLFTAGVLFADYRLRPSAKDAGDGTTTTSKAAVTNSGARKAGIVTDPPAAQSKVELKDFNSSLAALFSALKVSNKAGVKELYASHFKDHQKDPWNTPDISWGITKLQALQLGLIQQDDSMLRDKLAQSSAKRVYKGTNFELLENNEPASILLTYTWCQQSQRPELPKTRDEPDPLLLPTKLHCDQITSGMAVPGLDTLTHWVTGKNG